MFVPLGPALFKSPRCSPACAKTGWLHAQTRMKHGRRRQCGGGVELRYFGKARAPGGITFIEGEVRAVCHDGRAAWPGPARGRAGLVAAPFGRRETATWHFGAAQRLRHVCPDLIEGFDPDKIDCAAYTLRIGREVYVSPSTAVDAATQTKTVLDEGQDLVIRSCDN